MCDRGLARNWNLNIFWFLEAYKKKNISHKNWEISILTIKKRQSKVNTSSASHREFQREKAKQRTKKQKQQEKYLNWSSYAFDPAIAFSNIYKRKIHTLISFSVNLKCHRMLLCRKPNNRWSLRDTRTQNTLALWTPPNNTVWKQICNVIRKISWQVGYKTSLRLSSGCKHYSTTNKHIHPVPTKGVKDICDTQLWVTKFHSLLLVCNIKASAGSQVRSYAWDKDF
jgi:hypothetical protein